MKNVGSLSQSIAQDPSEGAEYESRHFKKALTTMRKVRTTICLQESHASRIWIMMTKMQGQNKIRDISLAEYQVDKAQTASSKETVVLDPTRGRDLGTAGLCTRRIVLRLGVDGHFTSSISSPRSPYFDGWRWSGSAERHNPKLDSSKAGRQDPLRLKQKSDDSSSSHSSLSD